MGAKYYRFMKDVVRPKSISEHADMKAYFRKGDYLAPNDGARMFLHLRLKEQKLLSGFHEDVEGFVTRDIFQEFLKNGTVVEVPQNIRELDLKCQTEICHLVLHCDRAYESLYLAEHWGEDLQTITTLRKNYDKLRADLNRVRDILNEKVIKPLSELALEKKEGLAGVLADAQARSADMSPCNGVCKDTFEKE